MCAAKRAADGAAGTAESADGAGRRKNSCKSGGHTLHINKLHETSVKKRGRGFDGESRRIPRLPCCHRQPLLCSFLPSQRQRRGGSSQESPTDTVKRWCSGDPCVWFFLFINFFLEVHFLPRYARLNDTVIPCSGSSSSSSGGGP